MATARGASLTNGVDVDILSHGIKTKPFPKALTSRQLIARSRVAGGNMPEETLCFDI